MLPRARQAAGRGRSAQGNGALPTEFGQFVPVALVRQLISLFLGHMRHPHHDQIAFEPIAELPVSGTADAARAELTALVVRAQAEDMEAQSQLVRLYSARIAGFIRTIVRNPNAIEDITQNVFVKMVRRLRWLREPVSFESWLFAMARSTALDYLRARSRRPEVLADDLQTFETADPSRPALMTEILEALNLALTQLSAKDRALVSMVVQGHSYQTIAASEGLTLGAVKARLTRVRPFLRAAVGLATGTRIEPPGTTDRRGARLAA
jgi:RNA polymerase sigma-70 factor (ECF subfamily)